jgi:hypothetical protein
MSQEKQDKRKPDQTAGADLHCIKINIQKLFK